MKPTQSNDVVESLVSTIIPVYNRSEMVKTAVDSVLAQTYRPIELILVDDGSSDQSGQVLDALAREHPETIRVIHKVNEGPGLAREAGRQVARGEFIQYLDSDDWLLPNKFADQVRALRQHPECGIAYGTSMLVGADGKVINPVSRWTGRRFDDIFPLFLLQRWWHTHTPLFRRTISDAAGAWPRQRPEDWDLEARMGALRPGLVHCGTTVSCQREHREPGRVSRGARDAYLRDEAWFLPRLHDCALRAGVDPDATEMREFSRWAFMRARDLGALGETDLAWKMLDLATRAADGCGLDMRLVAAGARLMGWRATGRLCAVYTGLFGDFAAGLRHKRLEAG